MNEGYKDVSDGERMGYCHGEYLHCNLTGIQVGLGLVVEEDRGGYLQSVNRVVR